LFVGPVDSRLARGTGAARFVNRTARFHRISVTDSRISEALLHFRRRVDSRLGDNAILV
jgi:hypothetical protein